MLKSVLSSVFGTRHEREVKRIQPLIDAINAEYERLHALTDVQLQQQTEKLRGLVHEATAELEAKIAERKEKKQ